MEEMLNPSNMMNMFQTINSTLQSKIENKEIDMNNLFGEASGLMNNGMMENMMGMFGNMMGTGNGQMPDMSSMMNMAQQASQQTPTPNQDTNESKKSKGNHDPDVVRNRLRKKLESKK
jgi:hypothetical protein